MAKTLSKLQKWTEGHIFYLIKENEPKKSKLMFKDLVYQS